MDAQPDRPPRARQRRVVGKRALTREQNRQRIIDAARTVFADLGYGAATVRHIIQATPLASGTFYNYFKSKDEVFDAIRDEAALAVRPALREARRKAVTMEGFVDAVFRSFFAQVTGNPADIAVKHGQGPHVWADTPEIVAGFRELREDVEEAITRGLLPKLDAEYLAAAMAGVALELAQTMQKRAVPDIDATIRFATALLLGGVTELGSAG